MSKTRILPFDPGNPKAKNEASNETDEIEGESVGPHMKQFAESASWNGFGNAARSKAFPRLLFWILMILGTTGLTVYHTYTISKEYLQYPYTTKIDYEVTKEINFPAVTFCNINPVMVDKLKNVQNDSNYSPLIQSLEGGWAVDDTATWRGNLTNLTSSSGGNWSSISTVTSWTTLYSNNTSLFQNFTPEYTSESNAYREFADLEDQYKMNISTDFDDLLIDCSFAGQPCTKENFTEIQSPYYGNCYVFNTGLEGIPIKSVSRSGPRFGLEVKFLVQQDEYLAQFAKSAGIKVAIHDQTNFPFPEDNGFSISPGFQTNVGIRKVEIKRLKAPYPSNCISLTSDQAYSVDAYAEYYGLHYTVKGCLNSCFQKALVRTCNCTDPFYLKQGRSVENGGVWYETCYGSTQEDCTAQTAKDYEAGRLNCAHCRPPCLETDFEKDISQSYWPSLAYESDLYLLYLERSPSFRRLVLELGTLPDIRWNSAKIAIYYRDLNYKKIEEDPKYPNVFNFLSEFGGTVGLWTGLSVIGMVEVVELLFDVIRISCLTICRKAKQSGAAPMGKA